MTDPVLAVTWGLVAAAGVAFFMGNLGLANSLIWGAAAYVLCAMVIEGLIGVLDLGGDDGR